MSTAAGLRRFTSAPAGPEGHRRWIALSVVMWAVLLDGLASSMGPHSADMVQRDLRIADATMPIVLFGYGLVFLFTLLPAGRLGDVTGRKPAFLAGAALFAAGALLCAAAPGPGTLIGGRLVQGLAAAIMIPQVLALVMAEFAADEHRERVAGYALYGVVVAFIAPAAGLLGDGLAEADLFGLGWRGLFLTLGLGAVVLFAVVAAGVRVSPREEPRVRMDPGGIALCLLGLLLLVYPLTSGAAMGWPAWVFVSMALSPPVFVAFAARQRRKERAGGSPLAVPALFRERAFAGGMVVIVVMSFTILGFFPFFSDYLQKHLGFSPGRLWLASLGWPVGILVASVADIRMAARAGRRMLLAGAVVMTLGIATLIPVFAVAGPRVRWWQIMPPLLVAGLGKGLMTPAMIHLVLARVRRRDIGSASGVLLAVQQVGGLVGFAVLGSVLAGIGQALWIETAGLVTVALSLLLFPRGGPRSAGRADHAQEATS